MAAAVLAALTLLPALLSILGHARQRDAHPAHRRARRDAHERRRGRWRAHGFWHGWALGVMRRPVLIMLGVSALLMALGWPILSLNLGTPSGPRCRKSARRARAIDLLNAQFPDDEREPDPIIAQTSRRLQYADRRQPARSVDALSTWLDRRAQHVTGVTSLTQFAASHGGRPAPTSEQLLALYSTGAYQQNPGAGEAGRHRRPTDDTTLITVNTDAPS